MFSRLFSGSFPTNKILMVVLVIIALGLLLNPWIFGGSRALLTGSRICIFIILVASYDMLIGYTGIVSFAHTLFFGIGAYAVAMCLTYLGASWSAILLGAGLGILVSAGFALLIGFVSLRVRTIFFAMITLAVASAFTTLVSQMYTITGGEDGLIFKIPRELTPAFKLVDEKIFGVRINGKLLNYYLMLSMCAVLFLLMLRIVHSPFGRVLQAIRENEFRAEAIGYRTVFYRTAATCLSAGFAAMAGVMMAISNRYVGPETTLSLTIMIDVLLMVVIGGMGSLYGAIVGTTLFILAQFYLQELMKVIANATERLPIIPNLFEPDRWLLWLGVIFILSVYFFPKGVVGRLKNKTVAPQEARA